MTSAKSELWLDSDGQIDFYDDPRLIDAATNAIAEQFRTTVAIRDQSAPIRTQQ